MNAISRVLSSFADDIGRTAPKIGQVFGDDVAKIAVGSAADDIGRLNPFKWVTDWVGNNRKTAMVLSAVVDLTSYEANNPAILNHLINQAKPAVIRTSTNMKKAQAPISNIVSNIIA